MSKAFEVATFKIEMEKFAQEIKQRGENLLKQGFKNFFDKYPYVGAVSWYQYTVYFNDGEPCPFYVTEFKPHFRIQEDEGFVQDDGVKTESYDMDEEELSFVSSECWDDLTDLESGCQQIEDTMESIFGDHVEIVANREGFKIKPYQDHD